MSASIRRFLSRPLFRQIGSLFLVAIFAATVVLVFLSQQSSSAFAATRKPTCAQMPTAAACNLQDPEREGCAADAQTMNQEDILSAGVSIGSVQRRYSPTCHAWWGRVFDNRMQAQDHLEITIGTTTISALPTFVSAQYRILYSPMMWDATPAQQPPLVTGAVEVAGAVPFPSATIPAGKR